MNRIVAKVTPLLARERKAGANWFRGLLRQRVLALLTALAATPISAQIFHAEQRLSLAHGSVDAFEFGRAVVVQGEEAIVGAPTAGSQPFGAAAVCKRNAQGAWVASQTLLPPGDVLEDAGMFGAHLALDGDHLAVAAPGRSSSTRPAGPKVFLFRRAPGGEWMFHQYLVAPSNLPVAAVRVSLSGDRLAVLWDATAAVARLYERQSGQWVDAGAGLTPPESQSTGGAPSLVHLSLNGERLVMSLKVAGLNKHKAFVFQRNAATSVWENEAVIAPPSGSASGFNADCVVRGDRLFLGAPDNAGDGSCLIYHHHAGTGWELAATVMPAESHADFGRTLCFDGAKLAVTGLQPGAIAERRVWLYHEESGETWQNDGFVSPITALPALSDGSNGAPVSLAGNHILLGFQTPASLATTGFAARGAAVMTLESPPATPVVQFEETSRHAREAATIVKFAVTISSAQPADVTLPLSVGGTASAPNPPGNPGDYQPLSPSSVTIPAGSRSGTITLTLKEDTAIEAAPDETVELTLGTPPAGIGLGTRSMVTLTIEDNDRPWQTASQKLQPFDPDLAADEELGAALSASGGTLVAGAPGGRSDTGAAYVFNRGGNGAWVGAARLTHESGAPSDRFGAAVSVDGDTLACGAPFRDIAGFDSGAVLVFERDGSGNWAASTELLPTSGSAGAQFGACVQLIGARLFIGAPGNGNGAVHVFERSGMAWIQSCVLQPPVSPAVKRFGCSLSVFGSRIVIGAEGNSGAGALDGAAFAYDLQGAAWTLAATILPADDPSAGLFGHAVTLAGDRIAIGAPAADAGSGVVYLFQRLSGGAWTQILKQRARGKTVGEMFGASVALSGNKLVVGASGRTSGTARVGAADVFEELTPGSWTFTRELLTPELATISARDDGGLGFSVAFAGAVVAVGSPRESGNQDPAHPLLDEGGVYLMDLGAPSATRTVSFLSPETILPEAAENTGTPSASVICKVPVVLGTPDENNAVVVPFAISGDLVAGTDYSAETAPLVFDPGQTVKMIVITVNNNSVRDFLRRMNITLGLPVGAAIGRIPTHVIQVVDDDAAAASIELSANERQGADGLGVSITGDDDWLAAGANSESQAGYVAVFGRDGLGNWSLAATIEHPSSGPITDEGFGASVSLEGNLLVVGGASSADEQSKAGAVFVFQRNGNGEWTTTQTIAYEGSTPFAHAVLLKDGSLFVGAGKEVNSADPVEVYTASGGGTFAHHQTIPARPDAIGFGYALARSGDWLAIGDPFADGETTIGSGAVFLYRLQSGDWVFDRRLDSGAPESFGEFGTSLAFAGDDLLVGAPFETVGSVSSAGRAHRFGRDTGGPNAWGHAAVLASGAAKGSNLGKAISSDGGRVAIRSTSSSILVFRGSAAGGWVQEQPLDAPADSLVVWEGRVAAGDPDGGSDGLVRIFQLANQAGFAASSARYEESAFTRDVVLRLNNTAVDPVTASVSVTGTALNGADYRLAASSISIPPDDNQAAFVVHFLDDQWYEGDETLTLGLLPIPGFSTTSNTLHSIIIADNDVPAHAPAVEQTTANRFTITRSPYNGAEVTHFRLAKIKGVVVRDDANQVLPEGAFVSVAASEAGLNFEPVAGAFEQRVRVVGAFDALPEAAGFAVAELELNASVGPVSFVMSEPEWIVSEGGREAVVEVVKSGGDPTEGAVWAVDVAFEQIAATEGPGALTNNFDAGDGGDEDYTIPPEQHRTLYFRHNTRVMSLPVPLTNDGAAEARERFRVRLTNARIQSAAVQPASIGVQDSALITIVDDDVLALDLAAKTTPVLTPGSGALRVTLSPSDIGAQWRLGNEPFWRNSGDIAAGLAPGTYYQVQFKPVAGFSTPGTHAVEVFASLADDSATYTPDGGAATGSVTVTLQYNPGPAPATPGQWRIVGTTAWQNSGAVLSGFAIGSHSVEFATITGHETPLSRFVVVPAGGTGSAVAVYQAVDYPESDPPVEPAVAAFGGMNNGGPLSHLGQIETPEGTATGTVVAPHVVLTAAHALFDEDDYAWLSTDKILWKHQRYAGTHEPAGVNPAGWQVFTAGYGADYQRQRGLEGTPGRSSLAARELDVAALHFASFAGVNGSHAGYVSSPDQSNNRWLSGLPRERFLAGYPVVGLQNASDAGKLFTTPSSDGYEFSHLYRHVYGTGDFRSHPGNSGGPVFVKVNAGELSAPYAGADGFFPAAIYLGERVNDVVVRGLDEIVAEMITRAEAAAGGADVQFTLSESATNEGSLTPHTISVTMNAGNSVDVTIPLLAGGSAERGVDYTLSADAITIPAGQTSGSVTITVLQDTLFEGSESIELMLGTVEGAIQGAQTQHIVHLADDEPALYAPVITVGTVSAEGGTFAVARNAQSGAEVTHFRVMEAGGIRLYQSDGITPVAVGQWITVAQGAAGLAFEDESQNGALARVVALVSATGTSAGACGTEEGVASLEAAAEGAVQFRLSSIRYSSGEETSQMIVQVIKNGEGAAAVTLDVEEGTAKANDFNAANGSEDYTVPPLSVRAMTFSAREARRELAIPLINDNAGEGNESFTVRLTAPTSSASLGAVSSTVCVIVDDETDATQLGQVAAGPLGMLTATMFGELEPYDLAGSAWRIAGESAWHLGGESLSGLEAGTYDVDFAPVFGFDTPPRTKENIAANQTLAVIGWYKPVGIPESSGSLTVHVSGAGGAGQWRRQGRTTWHNSGDTETGLKIDEYVVEFRHIAGQLEPPPRKVLVRATGTTVSASYAATGSYGIESAQALTLEEVNAGGPQQWTGKVVTELGESTGVVVQKHVVLTSASALFDEENLRYANEVRWQSRSHGAAQRPLSQQPRGWRVYGQGYAREYRAQRVVERTPHTRTVSGSEVDVAALFFVRENNDTDPAKLPARGGFSGYVMDNGSGNGWLMGTGQNRQVTGYLKASQGSVNDGLMHRIAARSDYTFSHFGEHVFGTRSFEMDRGLSGAAVWVAHSNGNWYPCALMLGAMEHDTGGGAQMWSVVRAIDGGVAHLIEEAEGLALTGGNSSGNQSAAVQAAPIPGYLGGRMKVDSNLAGRGWRLSAWTNPLNYYFGADYSISTFGTLGTQTVVFKPFANYVAPLDTPVTLTTVEPGVHLDAQYLPASDSYAAWLADYAGLNGTGMLDDSDNDGACNLLEYAFNLHPGTVDARPLTPGSGANGLPNPQPVLAVDGTLTALRIEWVQRKNSELTYTVERSTTPDGQGSWDPVTTPAPTLTDIDAKWQRAVLLVPPVPAIQSRCFIHLKITAP